MICVSAKKTLGFAELYPTYATGERKISGSVPILRFSILFALRPPNNGSNSGVKQRKRKNNICSLRYRIPKNTNDRIPYLFNSNHDQTSKRLNEIQRHVF